MFESPDQTHTSPISIFFSTIVLPPLIVIEKGPPAAGVGTRKIHLPFPSARTESLWLFQEGVIKIISPGSLHPHNLACAFCCSTILSLRTLGNRILAFAILPAISSRNKKFLRI